MPSERNSHGGADEAGRSSACEGEDDASRTPPGWLILFTSESDHEMVFGPWPCELEPFPHSLAAYEAAFAGLVARSECVALRRCAYTDCPCVELLPARRRW